MELTCNPTKYWLSVGSFFFFLFNFPPSFYLKSHDRTRIRDSLCQCGVTHAGQYRRSPVFPLIPVRDEFKLSSLNQDTENSFVYSLECFSIVLLLFWLAR